MNGVKDSAFAKGLGDNTMKSSGAEGIDYTQGLQGAIDLVSGLMMPGFDYNFQSNTGLSLDAAPTAFNPAAAQAQVQQSMAYGQQKGSNIGSGIGTALGVALAPLTGGLSIGIGQKLGSAAGGMIGGAINKGQAEDLARAREMAINRTMGAYRDIRSEADINQAQQEMRMQSLLDYYNM